MKTGKHKHIKYDLQRHKNLYTQILSSCPILFLYLLKLKSYCQETIGAVQSMQGSTDASSEDLLNLEVVYRVATIWCRQLFNPCETTASRQSNVAFYSSSLQRRRNYKEESGYKCMLISCCTYLKGKKLVYLFTSMRVNIMPLLIFSCEKSTKPLRYGHSEGRGPSHGITSFTS